LQFFFQLGKEIKIRNCDSNFHTLPPGYAGFMPCSI
jgi:hypothetical protein